MAPGLRGSAAVAPALSTATPGGFDGRRPHRVRGRDRVGRPVGARRVRVRRVELRWGAARRRRRPRRRHLPACAAAARRQAPERRVHPGRGHGRPPCPYALVRRRPGGRRDPGLPGQRAGAHRPDRAALLRRDPPAAPRAAELWLLPAGAIGCHEVDLVQRPDGRVLAGCARQLQDQVEATTNTEIPGGVQIVEATDPAHPAGRAAWQLPLTSTLGVGCLPIQFAHSIRFVNGGLGAYVSYWDAGTVHLDLTNPVARRARRDEARAAGRGRRQPLDDLANRGRWLVINQEDFSPSACATSQLGGWGEAGSIDGQRKLLGRFSTRDSRSTRTDGNFTVHNTEVALGRQFFSSWYSDGVVWWTMSDRGRRVSSASSCRRPGPPFGAPLVWGVYVDHVHHLILASDMGPGSGSSGRADCAESLRNGEPRPEVLEHPSDRPGRGRAAEVERSRRRRPWRRPASRSRSSPRSAPGRTGRGSGRAMIVPGGDAGCVVDLDPVAADELAERRAGREVGALPEPGARRCSGR